MKKILIMLFLLCSLYTNAQSIRFDGIAEDGRHQINVKLKDYRMGGSYYSIGLKIYESETDLDWRIVVSSTKEFTKDYVVLVKLFDGQIIELKSDSIQSGSYTNPRVTYGTGFIYPGTGMINNIGITTPSSVRKWTAIEACIKPEQLDSICNFGIAKFRVGNEYTYEEKEWKKDELGKYLSKSRKKIQDRLDHPMVRNAAKIRYPKSVHNNF